MNKNKILINPNYVGTSTKSLVYQDTDNQVYQDSPSKSKIFINPNYLVRNNTDSRQHSHGSSTTDNHLIKSNLVFHKKNEVNTSVPISPLNTHTRLLESSNKNLRICNEKYKLKNLPEKSYKSDKQKIIHSQGSYIKTKNKIDKTINVTSDTSNLYSKISSINTNNITNNSMKNTTILNEKYKLINTKTDKIPRNIHINKTFINTQSSSFISLGKLKINNNAKHTESKCQVRNECVSKNAEDNICHFISHNLNNQYYETFLTEKGQKATIVNNENKIHVVKTSNKIDRRGISILEKPHSPAKNNMKFIKQINNHGKRKIDRTKVIKLKENINVSKCVFNEKSLNTMKAKNFVKTNKKIDRRSKLLMPKKIDRRSKFIMPNVSNTFIKKHKNIYKLSNISKVKSFQTVNKNSLINSKFTVIHKNQLNMSHRRKLLLRHGKSKYIKVNTNQPAVKKCPDTHLNHYVMKSKLKLIRKVSSKHTSRSHSNVFDKNKDTHHFQNYRLIRIDGKSYKSSRSSLKRRSLVTSSAVKEEEQRRDRKTSFSKRAMQPGELIRIVQLKKMGRLSKINDHCLFYRKHGKCLKKEKGLCPFVHDPNNIAICTRFIKGECTKEKCPFSHKLDRNKMPTCSHFIEGLCTKEDCPYRHVKVNPNAPLCTDFLKGTCQQGEMCKKQHILICIDFQETGDCMKGKNCPLSHLVSKRRPPSKKRKSREINVSKGILGVENATKPKYTSKAVKSRSDSNRYNRYFNDINSDTKAKIEECCRKEDENVKKEERKSNDEDKEVRVPSRVPLPEVMPEFIPF